MTAKFTPASITIEVPAERAVTVTAATLAALLAGRRPEDTDRLYALLAPRTVTITEGTRVRLKVNPAHHFDFDFNMLGWDNADVTVVHVTDTQVRVSSELAEDFTNYTGPLEKILDVLEILGNEEPKAKPVPVADPEGWIEWDFSNDAGPDLPDGARVEVKFRDGSQGGSPRVSSWNWRDEGMLVDIVAYRIV